MPGTQIEKGIKALVVVIVEIVHILRRTGAVDDVFKVVCGCRMEKKPVPN
jgi:hypothetical protein